MNVFDTKLQLDMNLRLGNICYFMKLLEAPKLSSQLRSTSKLAVFQIQSFVKSKDDDEVKPIWLAEGAARAKTQKLGNSFKCTMRTSRN